MRVFHCNIIVLYMQLSILVDKQCAISISLVTPAASSGKHNVTVWCPSVCPSTCLSNQNTRRDSSGASTPDKSCANVFQVLKLQACIRFAEDNLQAAKVDKSSLVS